MNTAIFVNIGELILWPGRGVVLATLWGGGGGDGGQAERRPAYRMTNGVGGWVRSNWERGVRAKAVSSLRSATAVQDALRGLIR